MARSSHATRNTKSDATESSESPGRKTAAPLAGEAAAFVRAESLKARPNVLLLITDQQSWNMMSCTGNRWLKTPAMDGLAAAGVRFERTYVTNPVCVPSRFSLQTGQMPSSARITSNEDSPWASVSEGTLQASMGRLFREAGYDTVYGGKIHLPMAFRNEFAGHSYRYIEANARGRLAEACAAYLRGRHDRPFFLTASFVNPHDICYVAINDFLSAHGKPRASAAVADIGAALASAAGEDALDELLCQVSLSKDRREFVERHCPPLPANHSAPDLEPEAVQLQFVDTMPFRSHVRAHWTEEDWRIHSWLYHRLTEQVDNEIGVLLTGLRSAGLESSTLVVFTSDHGDLNGAHRLEHKSVLYDEALRVPLILSHKGTLPNGKTDNANLVSIGLDLLPTLCDFAAIDTPQVALYGHSVRQLAEGRADASWRSHIVAESGHYGRMILTDRYKYCRYSSGLNRELLTDLQTDPGELHNLAGHVEYAQIVSKHRTLLKDWMYRTWDFDGLQNNSLE